MKNIGMKTLDFIKVKSESDNSTFLNDFEDSVIEAEKNKEKKGKSLKVLLNEV